MARETLTINGLDLMAGTQWDVEDLTITGPGPVGDNPVVAGRVGSLWHQKPLGPGKITVAMWIGDPNQPRSDTWRAWEQVAAAVWRPHELSTLTWTMDDGATRTWLVELASDTVPRRVGSHGYRVTLEFTVPSGEMTT